MHQHHFKGSAEGDMLLVVCILLATFQAGVLPTSEQKTIRGGRDALQLLTIATYLPFKVATSAACLAFEAAV